MTVSPQGCLTTRSCTADSRGLRRLRWLEHCYRSVPLLLVVLNCPEKGEQADINNVRLSIKSNATGFLDLIDVS